MTQICEAEGGYLVDSLGLRELLDLLQLASTKYNKSTWWIGATDFKYARRPPYISSKTLLLSSFMYSLPLLYFCSLLSTSCMCSVSCHCSF